jgi:hypothetical protein
MQAIQETAQQATKHTDEGSAIADPAVGVRLRALALSAIGIAGILSADSSRAGTFTQDALTAPPVPAPLVERADRFSSVERVSSTTELIQKWNFDNRFFIKGDSGLSGADLGKIAATVRDHRDWTVLVARDASGERFTAPDGSVKSGYEAMLARLDEGLGHSANFRELISSRTLKPSGAILVICLNNNPAHGQVGYFAAEGRDAVDLGHAKWQGGLDALALSHLRDKVDIPSAIQNTIVHIDAQLKSREEGPYLTDGTKLAIGFGAGAVVLIGGMIWLAKKTGFGDGGSSGGGYYGGGGCGGGCGGGGGGFSSSGF